MTRLCVSTEDKPGEIGIIVALAMLILGTFQWAVITSITVDGLVRSEANTRITVFGLKSKFMGLFLYSSISRRCLAFRWGLLTSLDSDSLVFN